MNDAYHRRTGRWFFHNVQSVRVLDVLYGRNLSLQTLDGIICHNGEFERQVFETSGLSDFGSFDRVVESCWQGGEKAIDKLRPMTHAVVKAKPAATKGQYLKKIALSSTMGPGVRVDVGSVSN